MSFLRNSSWLRNSRSRNLNQLLMPTTAMIMIQKPFPLSNVTRSCIITSRDAFTTGKPHTFFCLLFSSSTSSPFILSWCSISRMRRSWWYCSSLSRAFDQWTIPTMATTIMAMQINSTIGIKNTLMFTVPDLLASTNARKVHKPFSIGLRHASLFQFQLDLLDIHLFHLSFVFHFQHAELLMRGQFLLARSAQGSDGHDQHNHRKRSQGDQ